MSLTKSRNTSCQAAILAWAIVIGSAVPGSSIDAHAATLDEVMDRWLQAVGGQEALAGFEVIYVRREAEMAGFRGTLEEWAAPDGRYRAALDLGDGLYTQVTVLDGDTGWRLDHNGKVVELSGEDLAAQRTSAYLSALCHLRTARDRRSELEYLGKIADSGQHRVRITPPHGVPVVFDLDSQSGLPLRSEQPDEDRTLVTTFEDWQVFHGIGLATRERQTTGDPQYDALFRVIEVRLDPELPANLFQRPAESADDLRFLSGTSATDIPIELYGVHVCLTVEVAGQPASFVFDTGAGATVINSSKAQTIGLSMGGKLEARGAGEASMAAQLIKGVSLGLPGVAIEGQTIVAIPLDGLQPFFGRPMDGILGYDLISRCVVTIDYANERMHLHGSDAFVYEGDGVVLPLRIEDGHPHVVLSVTPYGRDPIECEMVIDTGASGALGFSKPFTIEHDLLTSLPEKIYLHAGHGVGGETMAHVGRVESVTIGTHSLHDVLGEFSDDDAGAGAKPNTAGLLGGEILKRFTVTFDYEHRQVIFEPNARFSEPFDREMCGLQIMTGGPGAWRAYSVYRVLAHSPADSAGIREGDVLQAIDGRPAAEFSLPELTEYFKRDGQQVRLTLLRGDEVVEANVRLRRMI